MEKTLEIRYSAWDDQAEEYLSPACDDAESLADLCVMVADNRASLLSVWDDEKMVAAWVAGVAGDVLIVHAAGGYMPGVDLYQSCLFAILNTLPAIKRVRMNTVQLAIIRKVEKMGFKLKAATLEMEIAA